MLRNVIKCNFHGDLELRLFNVFMYLTQQQNISLGRAKVILLKCPTYFEFESKKILGLCNLYFYVKSFIKGVLFQ